MRTIVKWTGIGLLGLAALILLAGAVLYVSTSRRLKKMYSLPAETISIPSDPESISRGQRLVTARCGGCHGPSAGGTVIFQDGALGTISAANLTAGRGIGGEPLKDSDYIAAIRHGVSHAGRPILTMPSEFYYYINDQELGEMIAYLQSSTPIENPLPATRITPLGIALIGAGAFGDLIAAEKIDHQAARPAVVEPGVTVAYGDYLVRAGECRTCHGMNLNGGKDPDPNAPPAPSLTPGGELSTWSEADFIKALRTGSTPGGRQMSPFMPWMYIRQMTDDELKAMWLYLQSLPLEGQK
ncbi:MAG: c-type cytochrome [Anaerolineae bacterium]|nr:c-type cytochrome [Anaerolineae bacterium]